MGCFAHTRWSEAVQFRRERDAEQLPQLSGLVVRSHVTGRGPGGGGNSQTGQGSSRLETSPESGGPSLSPAFVYVPWHLDPWTWSVALQTSPPRSAGLPPDSWLGKAWFSVAGFSVGLQGSVSEGEPSPQATAVATACVERTGCFNVNNMVTPELGHPGDRRHGDARLLPSSARYPVGAWLQPS